MAVLVAGALACGCDGADRQQSPAGSDQAAEEVGQSAPSAADRPLAEFEPLTAPDLDLYLKVMREAARRLDNLSEADREAMQVWRELTQGAPRASVPSPEEVERMQRAGELAAMDETVAREMGLAHRFSSISGRVDRFLLPDIEAGGEEPATPEERARVQERIRRFRELDHADSVLLQPQRAELAALRGKVKIIAPPADAAATD